MSVGTFAPERPGRPCICSRAFLNPAVPGLHSAIGGSIPLGHGRIRRALCVAASVRKGQPPSRAWSPPKLLLLPRSGSALSGAASRRTAPIRAKEGVADYEPVMLSAPPGATDHDDHAFVRDGAESIERVARAAMWIVDGDCCPGSASPRRRAHAPVGQVTTSRVRYKRAIGSRIGVRCEFAGPIWSKEKVQR